MQWMIGVSITIMVALIVLLISHRASLRRVELARTEARKEVAKLMDLAATSASGKNYISAVGHAEKAASLCSKNRLENESVAVDIQPLLTKYRSLGKEQIQAEQSRIAAAEAADRRRKEDVARAKAAEAAEVERLLREQRERESAAKKAQEFYGTYKQSASNLTTSILHVLSVIETGVNYAEYQRLVGEANFELNKIEASLNGLHYDSLVSFKLSIFSLSQALDSWQSKIKYDSDALYDKLIQDSWKAARESYNQGMALLGENK
jgi:hypothetical protein